MFTGLYTSAAGLLAQMKNMDIISNNLANINTSGFKKDKAIFRSFYDSAINTAAAPVTSAGTFLRNKDSNSMVVIEKSIVDFSDGIIKETGNPLDIAVQGDGFLELQGPNAETYFTRAGSFQLNEAGEIVDSKGFKLMGDFGAIVIEAGAGSIKTKDIVIASDGLLTVGEDEVDKINVIRFIDNDQLKKVGHNLYTNASDENYSGEPFDGSIAQGHVELSNVNPVEEMTSMIATSRAFEAYQKVILAIMDDTTEKTISLVGRKG